MGSWPPRQDLHLEMDGSFATYYAWLKIQTGEVDSAIVCGHGKTSEGEPERVLNLQLDPYYQAPLGLTPTATAALQASAYQARTGATDADFAAVAARNRTAGARNPDNQVREAATADALRQTPWVVEPLRRGLPAAASARAPRASCSRPRARPRRSATSRCGSTAWTTAPSCSRSARATCRAAPGAALAAQKAFAMAGLGSARDVDLVELLATNPAEELIVCEALGLDAHAAKPVDQPVGRRAVRQSRHEHGPHPARRGVPPALRTRRRAHRRRARGAPSRTPRRATACSRTSSGCSGPSGGGREAAGRRRRGRTDAPQGASLRREHPGSGARGGRSRARRRRAASTRTSTPSSWARRPTCWKA